MTIKCCPVCKSSDCVFYDTYNGNNFLSCKSIIQCTKCELFFTYKMPSNDELDIYYTSGLYYDKVSNPYDKEILKFSINLAKTRLELIAEKINVDGFNYVLDVGAGNACYGKLLFERYPNVKYDAIEPDSSVSDKWGDWVNQRFKSIDQLESESYNLVILNQVLEHVNNPVEFINSFLQFVNPDGYIYIDVPYKDYIYKPSVEPHLLFWNKKSLSIFLEKVGCKMLFCNTAGMPHRIAKRYFNKQSIFQKLTNPWLYKAKINSLMSNISFLKPFDTFKQFQSENYGGDRQWLRCIAQKIN